MVYTEWMCYMVLKKIHERGGGGGGGGGGATLIWRAAHRCVPSALGQEKTTDQS